MKTAIYIEDGVVQLVMTPENDFETNALKSFKDKETSTRIYNGQFYDCNGGWTRQKDIHKSFYGSSDTDVSLIIRIET